MNLGATDPDRPNVLLVCCDHLRADWLRCNGHPVMMTPQIDELANEGVNFAGSFSQCPVCVPARRVLMTGQGCYSVHMFQNRDGQPFPEGPKLAAVLTAAGYQTFASGKLHTSPQRNRIGFEDVQLNEEGRRQGPMQKDDYEAFLDDAGYGHLAYTHGLGNNEYGVRMSPLPEPYTTTHWTAQKAMQFFDRRDPTRPFFLYVSFDKPHPPITPPAEYYDLYRDVRMPEPVRGDWVNEKLPTDLRLRQLRNNYDEFHDHPLMIQQSLRGYAAMVTHIDSMLGVLLGQMREHGVLNNTLIIFTSDHGDHLFDHGGLAKSDFLQGPANVPFIVRPPRPWAAERGFRPGRVNTSVPVELMDIMPTILDVCGVGVPEAVEGRSLVPQLLDDGAPFRAYTFGRCGACYGVSDGQIKYIWWATDDKEFLFDLAADPHDLHDLSEEPQWRAVLRTMRERMKAFMERNGDERIQDGELKPDMIEPDLRAARARTGWNNRGRH